MSNVPPFEAYSNILPILNQFVPGPNLNVLETGYGYQPFDFQSSISIPAVGTGFQTVLKFLVPDGFNGVIRRYQCNFTGGGFIDGSGDLLWQIQYNGKPIQNYESILTERGDPNLPRETDAIHIYANQNIQFVVNHVSNPLLASGYIVCGLGGFYYPAT